MSDLQTREQMLAGIVKPADILDLLGKVDHVQYKTGWQSKHLAADAIREITRLRTALSEAEQRVQEAKRVATNAEHYGYMHGVQAAADIAAELANAQKQSWDDHVASGVKTNATSFHTIFSELASRIRALIPSEPHDAEGRE